MGEDRPLFELTASQHLDPQIVIADFGNHFRFNPGKVFFVRAAVHEEIPAFIQLVGTALAWAPIAIAASAYLKRLAEKAADATWDLFKREKPKVDDNRVAMAALISTLHGARVRMGEKGTIIFGLNFPDSHWGSVVIVKDHSEEVLAIAVAKFASRADDIFKTVQQTISMGSKPLGYVHIEFENDRVRLHWIDQDFKLNDHYLV